MPRAGVREYEHAFALIAGATPEGFRVIDVWDSVEAFERFERDVLAPPGLGGMPPVEFPVHALFAP